MMIRTIAWALLLLTGSLASLLINAQTIYQSTDKNGNPVFTDQPQPAAKPIELKSINTTPAVAPSSSPAADTAAFKGYSKVAVAVPSSIPNGLAPTTVGIAIEPQLRPGHSWQLSLDGSPIEQGQETSATIEKMERGQHQFQLNVIDESGHIVGNSAPTDVFVYWPSKNR